MEEKTIILKCQKRNSEAQKELYKLYGPYLMGIALRYIGNREDAEEIFHDTMIKIFKHIDSFKFNSSFKTWMSKICVNTSLDYIRKRKRTLLIEHISENVADELPNDFNEEFTYEIETAVKLLNELPDNQKLIINMFLIDEFSHKEIAEKLNISVDASKSQYRRAKNHLIDLYNQKMKVHEQRR